MRSIELVLSVNEVAPLQVNLLAVALGILSVRLPQHDPLKHTCFFTAAFCFSARCSSRSCSSTAAFTSDSCFVSASSAADCFGLGSAAGCFGRAASAGFAAAGAAAGLGFGLAAARNV